LCLSLKLIRGGLSIGKINKLELKLSSQYQHIILGAREKISIERVCYSDEALTTVIKTASRDETN
jgi:hypothetical protein